MSLGGATLALSTPWFQDLERTFVIIRNDGDGDVLGSFDGLPKGSRLKAPGTESEHLTISYRGGDGNDMTLTSTVQAGDVNTGFRTGDLLSSGMAEVYSAIGLGDGSVLIGGLVFCSGMMLMVITTRTTTTWILSHLIPVDSALIFTEQAASGAASSLSRPMAD